MSSFHLKPQQAGLAVRGSRAVTDGAVVALGGGLCARLPMALVRELIGRAAATCTCRFGAQHRRPTR